MSVVPSDRDSLALGRWIEHRDAEAFKELVGRHSGIVYATCRRVLGDASEAEDAAQECFESLARFKGTPPARLGPWLHRVATNLSLKRTRSRLRRRKREEAYASERPVPAEPGWDDVYGHVDEAIAALPDRLRAPLVAHFLEGQTHQAIAEALGVPRQTVTDRISRGVKEVRRALARRGIAITIPTLSAFLSAEMAEASPASFTATLGKLAVSGVRGGIRGAASLSASHAATVGGTLLMKKIVSVLVVLCLAVAGFYVYRSKQPDRPKESPPVPFEGGVYEEWKEEDAVTKKAVEPPAEETPEELAVAEEEFIKEGADPYTDNTAFLRGHVGLEDGSPVQLVR